MSVQQHPGISIIVLTHNGARYLDRLFETFFSKNTYSPIEFLIVDHASKDDTADVVTKWAQKLFIRHLIRDKNYSFAVSNNYAVRKTRYPYLLFLNNDIVYTNDVLPLAAAQLRNENIGAVGIRLDDDPQNLPKGRTPSVQHVGIRFAWDEKHRFYRPYQLRLASLKDASQVKSGLYPAVTGAFLLCRKKDFEKLGGFCEEYDYGFEDVDFCLQVQEKLKKKCLCINDVSLQHVEGASRKIVGRDTAQARQANNVSVLSKRQAILDDSLFQQAKVCSSIPSPSPSLVSHPHQNVAIKYADLLDVEKYVHASSDLIAKVGKGFNPVEHFIKFGAKEVMSGSRPLYSNCTYHSEKSYLAKNRLAREALASGNVVCGLEYFLRYEQNPEANLKRYFNNLDIKPSISILYLCETKLNALLPEPMSPAKLLTPVHIASANCDENGKWSVRKQDIESPIDIGEWLKSLIDKDWLVVMPAGWRILVEALYRLYVSKLETDIPLCVYGSLSGSKDIKLPKFSDDLFASHNFIGSGFVLNGKACSRIAGQLRKQEMRSISNEILLRHWCSGGFFHRLDTDMFETQECDLPAIWSDEQACDALKQLKSKLFLSAVSDHIERNDQGVAIPKFRVVDEPSVAIIIPFKDKVNLLKACLTSIRVKTSYKNYRLVLVDNQSKEPATLAYLDEIGRQEGVSVLRYDKPFNFSAINNFAASHIDAEYLLFLNNDTEVISNDWIECMLAYAQRDDTGAVGALLTYPNGEVQHAGVVLGMNGLCGHAYAGYQPRDLDRDLSWRVARPVEAVTGACLLISKRKFHSVGGFDEENLAIAFNDVDLCMRLRIRGLTNFFVPQAVLVHHESVSRQLDRYDRSGRFAKEVDYFRKTYKNLIDEGDRYFDVDYVQQLSRLRFKLGSLAVLILTIRMQKGYGVDLVVDKQARELIHSGVKVVVGVLDHDPNYYSDLPYKLIVINRKGSSLRENVQRVAAQEGCEVVIAHTSPFFEVLPSLVNGYKTIAYEHGDPAPSLFPDKRERSIRESRKRYKRKHVYPVVNRVIAISKFVSEDIDWPQADIIYNGADHLLTGRLPSTEELNQFRERFGINHESCVYLCVSRLGKGEENYKGIDYFERFKSLFPESSNVKFIVLGRGDEECRERLLKQGFIVVLNASDQELKCAYMICNAFFSFSKWEGFNLPLVEAQRFGKPAFALKHCSHPEVTQLAFPSIEEIYNYVSKLDKDDLDKIGRMASRYIDRLTWQTNGKELAAVIAEVAGISKKAMPAIRQGKVSVCILTKDKPHFIIPCVKSVIEHSRNCKIEVLIGDTGSSDEEVLRFYEALPDQCKLFKYNFYNFSKVNNYLSRHAEGEYLIFLNNDTLVEDDHWLEELKKPLEFAGVGAVGPKLLFRNGTIQHAGVEIFLNEPYRYIGWHPYRGLPADITAVEGLHVVPAVTGACLCTRAEDFRRLGGFSEEYREECQDVDYCLRLAEEGKQSIYTGATWLYHFENGTREISESPVDRSIFRQRWADFLESSFLAHRRQRSAWTPLIKLTHNKSNPDLIKKVVAKYPFADITYVVPKEMLSVHARDKRFSRTIEIGYPDNYRYQLEIKEDLEICTDAPPQADTVRSSKVTYGRELHSVLRSIVCGYERGGTTMLNTVLKRHPRLDSGFECGMLLAPTPRGFLSDKYSVYNGSLMRDGWGLTDEDLRYICETDDWGLAYFRLRERAKKIENKEVQLFDKTPIYMKHLNEILDKIDKVKAVVIIKQPLGVLWSWIKRHPDRTFITPSEIDAMCRRYKEYADGFIKAQQSHPDRIMSLKYGEFCSNPEEHIRAVCEFLDIEFYPYMMQFSPEYEVHGHFVDIRYIDEYKTGLKESEYKQIRSSLGELFDGY